MRVHLVSSGDDADVAELRTHRVTMPVRCRRVRMHARHRCGRATTTGSRSSRRRRRDAEAPRSGTPIPGGFLFAGGIRPTRSDVTFVRDPVDSLALVGRSRLGRSRIQEQSVRGQRPHDRLAGVEFPTSRPTMASHRETDIRRVTVRRMQCEDARRPTTRQSGTSPEPRQPRPPTRIARHLDERLPAVASSHDAADETNVEVHDSCV